MLKKTISKFLEYFKLNNFSKSSLSTLSSKLRDFQLYISKQNLKSINDISYAHLIQFIIHDNKSIHVKKSRVWAIRQFFHYLKLHNIIPFNIAMKIP